MQKYSHNSRRVQKELGGDVYALSGRVEDIETEIGHSTYTGTTITAGIAVAQYMASNASLDVNVIKPRITATPFGSSAVDISNGSEYTATKDGYVFIENNSNVDNDYFGVYIKTGDWGQGFRIGKLEGSFPLFIHAGTVIQAFHTNPSATTPQSGGAKFWPLNY